MLGDNMGAVMFLCIMVFILLAEVTCNPITQITNIRSRTDLRSSQLWREKRQCSVKPFDVLCHGYCPKTKTRDWEGLVRYWNCSARYGGTTYHCAKNSSGEFVGACAEPKRCKKGTEPIITFPPGHQVLADVDCEKCEEKRYNPDEGKMSDAFSVCPYVRRQCRSSDGEIECDIITGVERQWTNSKCMCNIRENFIPRSREKITCIDDYSLRCVERRPCPDTPDGQKQEYLLSTYLCSPVCGEGYYPRDHLSDDCFPKSIDINVNMTTADANVNITSAISTNITVTTKPVTVNQQPNGTTDNTGKNAKEQESDERTRGQIVWISIVGVVAGLIFAINPLVGIIYYFCIYEAGRETEKGCRQVLKVICCWLCLCLTESSDVSNKESSDVSNKDSSSKIDGNAETDRSLVEQNMKDSPSANYGNDETEKDEFEESDPLLDELTVKEIKKVLNKCVKKIKNEMFAHETILEIRQRCLFEEVQRNDLWDLDRGKEKRSLLNCEIWDMLHKQPKYYEEFKQCLKASKQTGLLEYIQNVEKQERKNDTELDTRTHETEVHVTPV